MTVNIYTYTTAKGAKNKTVGFAYVIEAIIKEKPVTATKTGVLKNIGKNEAEAQVIKEALQRVKSGNAVNIYTQSPYMAAVLTEWLHTWIKDGVNSKGEPIKEIYKQMADFLVTRPLEKVSNEGNEYSKWLRMEAERMKNENS